MVGLVAVMVTTAVLVAIEGESRVTEDVVTAAPPVPTPTVAPEPSPEPEPEPPPTPDPTSAPELEGTAQAASGTELANTDGELVALVDESYVPAYAAVGDLTEYDAHVSAPLEVPTPTAAPAPAAAPEAPTAPPPTPTIAPTPAPKEEAVDAAPEPEPEPESSSDEDAGDNGGSGGDGGPTPQQWAQLRACESGGNYQIVSANGLYHGAYQFSAGTWDWVASYVDSGLVGVLPSEASPGVQDAMAQALFDLRGAAPWPHCGRYLD